ncbi:MAG: hypothetical protein VW683_02685 [Betaproteobacteria bacterium]
MWSTEHLERVMSNIAVDPSSQNIQTQIMSLAEDECQTLRNVLLNIERFIYQREEVFEQITETNFQK